MKMRSWSNRVIFFPRSGWSGDKPIAKTRSNVMQQTMKAKKSAPTSLFFFFKIQGQAIVLPADLGQYAKKNNNLVSDTKAWIYIEFTNSRI